MKEQKMITTKYIKNLKSYIGISILFPIFFLLTISSAQAKNLGVWGPLFPIEELDIREFIYQRLNEMKQNGEMEKLNAKFIKNAKEHILRPPPVKSLSTADNPKTFYYDPTYVLSKDIEDHEGNVIAKKGTTINPLDTIRLRGVLFFFDADDKRQIKWALTNTKKYDYVRYILVKGNIKETGKRLNDRIYFDQQGLITKQLGIKHIPCIVKQEKKKLRIQEFALKNDTDKQTKVKQNKVPTK